MTEETNKRYFDFLRCIDDIIGILKGHENMLTHCPTLYGEGTRRCVRANLKNLGPLAKEYFENCGFFLASFSEDSIQDEEIGLRIKKQKFNSVYEILAEEIEGKENGG